MNNNKGMSIYFAVIIMSMTLAIVLGVATIVVRLSKSTAQLGTSVTAFYAADTGMERLLHECASTSECSDEGSISGSLDNGSNYYVTYDNGALHATSTGSYGSVKRSIFINRQ